LSIPKEQGFSRSIIIATDGYVTVEEAAFELIRNNLGEANFFPFGIGSSVNRHLIEGMARIGQGEAFVVTKPNEAPEKAKKLKELIQFPVLTDVDITFDRFQVYDADPRAIPDVLADRPLMVYGKWRGRPRGSIEIRGKTGNGTFKQKIDVGKVSPKESNAALRYLWARHRVTLLSDYNRLHSRDERVKEVTTLGLTYNLLTAYTSFVAIDSKARVKGGQADKVVQPLPLPLGVSDLAVGGRALQKRAVSAPTAPMVYRAKEAEYENTSLRAEEANPADAEDDALHGAEDASFHLEKIKVSRGLSKSQVRNVIDKILPTLDRCMTPKKRGPHFRVLVTFIVDPSGRVSKVILDMGDPEDKALGACLTRNLKALLFPAPSKSAGVKISCTLRLR
jgi:Ca-activated chloride channel family protein